MPLQSLLRQYPRSIIALYKNSWRGLSSSRANRDTDSCGIPLKAAWSVNQLLSSYPSPKLSYSTINRLYELSALTPPQEGTPQYDAVKRDLEEMIKLVEAVRLVDTSGIVLTGRGEKEDADKQTFSIVDSGETGQELLKYAARTKDQFYAVDSERKR